jgi:hypothetical protein
MAKMTAKYLGAIEIARSKNIPITDDQEALYTALGKAGFLWDKMKHWYDISQEPAEQPSDVLRVRVWAKTEDVEAQAGLIVRTLTSGGYRLIEQSEPYICRPPKQLESRIYLTFIAD